MSNKYFEIIDDNKYITINLFFIKMKFNKEKYFSFLRNSKMNFKNRKIEILRKKNPFYTFFANLYYLTKYNIKTMYFDPNINIGQVTELAAIKTKFLWDTIKVPKIMGDMETINELINTNKSIIRMGDGEFNLMLGYNNAFEKGNEVFKNTFREIFYNDDPNLMVGTRYDMFRMNTNFCHSNIGTYRFQYLIKNYNKIKDLYNFDKTYYSACFIYPYLIYEGFNHDPHFNGMRKIWQDKKVTIITGDRVYKKIKYNVFDNAGSISYIYGPTKGAFKEYDSLLEKILKQPKDSILCFALGPCGKLLGYEAYKRGYRILDVGHLIKNYDFYMKRFEQSDKEFCTDFRSHNLPD